MTGVDERVARRTAEAVARWAPGAEVRELRALEGGHSGQTLLARLVGAPSSAVVVKAGAPGRPAVGRHDVLRQARVLAAVAAAPGVRVPRVLLTDDGEPQVVLMSFEAGDATEPVLDGGGRMAPDLVTARAGAAARMLARLHAVDVATVGEEPVLAVADELARWSRTMAVVDPDLVPGAEELQERLAATIPAPRPPAVVHGDYRLGNVLFDGPEPTGIIDWEIWSVTDPRVDLGWFLLSCEHEDFPGVGTEAPGMPPLGTLVGAYEEVAGPVPDVPWFLAFARFKMAAIMAHNLRRHREGRHHDPFQERLPPTIASMVRRGLSALTPTRSAS